MRHGYITNVSEVAKSIRGAVDQAQKNSGAHIKRAFISIGGIGLGAIISTGSVNTTKADSEITDLDVKRVIDESEKELPNLYIQNRKIIHTVPLEYRIDGKRVLGKPQGLKGLKLEARVLYITCLSHHLSDILLALEEADIEALDVIASPMAGSAVTLQKTQKIAGCLFANIGSETTSIMVFENNIPISMEVFPFGSNDVTNDIALGLKVSLEDADEIKRGNDKGLVYSKKKLDEIVIARLSDIFDLIDDHLKRIDRSGLLPAGIVITGGGAGLQNIDELAKIALHLPAKQAQVHMSGNIKNISHENEWSVAYGLAILGLSNDDNSTVDIELLGVKRIFEKTGKNIWGWLKRFLP
jgi:cell division protein FtsA